jgi:hypothetical protein
VSKRKTFAAREDLINGIQEIAKRRDIPLYGMINETFELTIRAEKQGVSLRDLLEERRVLRDARVRGFILVPENMLYEMAEKVRTKRNRSWLETGHWLAKRYLSNDAEDPFQAFKKDLEDFTWNISELDIEEAGDEVSIRVISPRFTESYTFLFAAFLEGALKVFGYIDVASEVSRGTIRLRARREGEHGEGA